MGKKVLGQLIPALLGLLKPELLKKAADALLDVIEDSVEKSSTKVDDMLILPLCKMMRNTFDIPDEDE